MKRTARFFLTLILVSGLFSCGKEGFNQQEADRLCQMVVSGGHPSFDDYTLMMEQEQWSFDDRRQRMEELLEIKEPLKFAQKYQELKNDNEFMAMLKTSERLWRILSLAQPHFSNANIEAFKQLNQSRKIIDQLDDDILSRLR